jgi:TonB family protein
VIVNERPPESAPPASNGPGGAGSQDGSGNSGAGQHQVRIQLPQILNIQLPEYTGKARDRKVEGELVVRALFQRDGQIRDIKVGKGLGYGLDQRAVETVKRIGFAPAEIDRQQVDAWVDVVFNFALTEVSVYVRASAAEVTLKGSN